MTYKIIHSFVFDILCFSIIPTISVNLLSLMFSESQPLSPPPPPPPLQPGIKTGTILNLIVPHDFIVFDFVAWVFNSHLVFLFHFGKH